MSGVEAKVLGQLLLAQSVVTALPDDAVISFIEQGLADIPGVDHVEFKAGDSGEAGSPYRFKLTSGSTQHGEIVFFVAQDDLFAPYADHIRNFCFMLAVILEERRKRRIIDLHQHHLEEVVCARTLELANERNTAQRYLDVAGVMLMALDRQGRITMINKQGTDILGRSESQLLGCDWFAQFVPAEDREPVRKIFDRVMCGEAQAPQHHVNRIIDAKGRERTMAWNDTVLRNEAGEATGTLSSAEDITARRRAEAELDQHRHHLESLVASRTADLAQAKEAAEAASLAKSAFLANMSHEIRTPLSAILGMSTLLRRRGVTPTQADRLDKIDLASRHLLETINDILDISKIEAGKFVVEEVPVDIAGLLYNVHSIMGERALAKGLVLRLESGGFAPGLLGDPTRLRQAILNYVSNAIKFTARGSITLRAYQQEESDDCVRVRFEVEDSGIGIAPETLSRLFSAFEQADHATTRKYGGTGLGLAITRRLAEQMGGEVGADSAPGSGSTFWLTARLKKAALRDPIAPYPPSDAEHLLRTRFAGTRILVVDDEPLNLIVCQSLLEDSGLVVDSAGDGADAVLKAREESYALILMDVQMPRLNGLDATQQIRALPGYRQTPVLALTANAYADDRASCLAAGMNDFIAKPIDPDDFFSTLLRWLESAPV